MRIDKDSPTKKWAVREITKTAPASPHLPKTGFLVYVDDSTHVYIAWFRELEDAQACVNSHNGDLNDRTT